MKKSEVLREINKTQDFYLEQLVKQINTISDCKNLYFTSDTGTGKCWMMGKLINKMPEYFFVVTTLSKGKLRVQVENSLNRQCRQNNFLVLGSNEYTVATKKQAVDYLKMLPDDKPIIWLRDEGHITTTKWSELLENRIKIAVNFSATNKYQGIQCNFVHTMMLRTVEQHVGGFRSALDKLAEVKKQHSSVKNYNPCALFRIIGDESVDEIIKECDKRNLKVINITDEKFNMVELCEDDNEYDVIINKHKITEGIDLRRCHVIFMNNQPSNDFTTIQVIGRARRNALLWRNDIDIFLESNKELLYNTRKCYVYFNIPETELVINETGNFQLTLCDTISVEALKPDIEIYVEDGVLHNGLKVIELRGKTGNYHITYNEKYKCNVVDNPDWYEEKIEEECEDTYIINLNKYLPCIGNAVLSIDFKKSLVQNDYYIQDKVKKRYVQIKTYCESKKIKVNMDFMRWNSFFKINEPNTFAKLSVLQEFTNELYKLNSATLANTIYFESININIPAKKVMNYMVIQKDLSSIGTLYDEKSNCFNPILFQCIKKLEINPKIHYMLERFKKNKTEFNNSDLCNYQTMLVYKLLMNPQIEIEINDTVKDFPAVTCKMKHEDLHEEKYSYKKITSNKELAIIGPDTMHYGRGNWTLDKSVTSKITKYCKFNNFLCDKYKEILTDKAKECYSGTNNFNFPEKANSCFGYCVEYYAKYIIYGENYISAWLSSKKEKTNEAVISACMNKYKEEMSLYFGEHTENLVTTISEPTLKKEHYREFVKSVVSYGKKAAERIEEMMHLKSEYEETGIVYNSNLSVEHISGKCDFVNRNTILDLKCTNTITTTHIKQVLGYYYLSTYRSDLQINRLIIYDVVRDKNIIIRL